MIAAARRPEPLSLLVPFDETRELSWNEAAGKGRVVVARRNRLDDWYYACHFREDPVMPGCWGLDMVWQALRRFALERGLPDCRPVAMEGVSFFGQVRPHDREVVAELEVATVERDGPEALLTASARVLVDGEHVYTIQSAQVGTSFWEAPAGGAPALPPPVERRPAAPIARAEFSALSALSRAEVLALARGNLLADPGGEMPLLPDSLMLEISEVRRLSAEPAGALAVRANGPREWFYPMNAGVKPAALLVDGVWQLMGVYHAWSGSAGIGRALGFERVEFHGEVGPDDGGLVYDLRVIKALHAGNGDAFLRADAEVYAGTRRVMTLANASVGCHRGIRYDDYPMASARSKGGRLKV